jgi:ABC-type polysaccharide/polyol phosphate transport system ATPase subunit
MEVGQIVAEGVSRRFRVNPNRNLTLKEAILRPEMRRTEEIWALRDVSFEIEPGASVGFIGRNGSGKTTLLRLIAGIFTPTTGRLRAGGSVGSLLELGAGFHQDFTGRENIFLSGSIYGLKRKYVRERLDEIVSFAELERFIDLPVRTYSSGMHMRLGFAIAVHVDADILLLDEVFAVGDEAFQRKCIGKILEFKERGGTVCFVSHSAAAVERLCERALLLSHGHVEFDGHATEAINRYHKSLALEETPDEVGAGLREWGSGEVRIASVTLSGVDGEARTTFLSGEPLTITLQLQGEQPVPAPVLSLEVRDSDGSLLGANQRNLGELGWDGAPGERELRFMLERLPLGEGEFQISVSLTDAVGTRRYHRVDGAVHFVVEPSDNARGALLLDGDWALEEAASTEDGAETTVEAG